MGGEEPLGGHLGGLRPQPRPACPLTPTPLCSGKWACAPVPRNRSYPKRTQPCHGAPLIKSTLDPDQTPHMLHSFSSQRLELFPSSGWGPRFAYTEAPLEPSPLPSQITPLSMKFRAGTSAGGTWRPFSMEERRQKIGGDVAFSQSHPSPLALLT